MSCAHADRLFRQYQLRMISDPEYRDAELRRFEWLDAHARDLPFEELAGHADSVCRGVMDLEEADPQRREFVRTTLRTFEQLSDGGGGDGGEAAAGRRGLNASSFAGAALVCREENNRAFWDERVRPLLSAWAPKAPPRREEEESDEDAAAACAIA